MLTILTFYRKLLYPSTAVTLFSCYLIIDEGSGRHGLILFWLKVVTLLVFGTFLHLSNAGQLYFFHNLGYSTRRLYTLTALLDLGIWLLLTIATILIV
jgi:hypothetical protein